MIYDAFGWWRRRYAVVLDDGHAADKALVPEEPCGTAKANIAGRVIWREKPLEQRTGEGSCKEGRSVWI